MSSLISTTPEAQATHIANTIYELRAPRLSPLAGGYQNQVWRVQSRGHDDVVLRRCPPVEELRFRRRLRSQVDQEWEQRYQLLLADAGLPVPRPLPTSDGRWCHRDDAGAWWSLSEYRPGAAADAGDQPVTLQLMDRLAELHQAGAPIDGQLGPRPLMGELFAVPTWLPRCDRLAVRSLAECLQAIAASGGDHDSEYIAAYRKRLDHIRLLVDELQRAAADPNLADCPRIPIHSDYWTLNVACDGARVTAIYDFDDSHRDLRIHDVAQALSRCCRLPTGGIDEPLARTMLEHYQQRCPLADAELRHLPTAIVAKECWYLLPGLAMQLEDPTVDRRLHLGMRIDPALWHLANRAQWLRIAGLTA